MNLILKFLSTILLFILFIVFIVPNDLIQFNIDNFDNLEITLPKTLDKYRSTLKLKSTTVITRNIIGGESIVYNKQLKKFITGSLDGYLYEFYDNFNDQNNQNNENTKRLFSLINEKQLNSFNGKKFSRPLGMKLDSNNNLWIIESYFGIYRVKNLFNTNSSSSEPIIEFIMNIDEIEKQTDRKSVFIDDLTIIEKSNDNFIIYFTSSSSLYTLNEFSKILIKPDKTGRILSYNLETKKIDTIIDNLIFPNGIETFYNDNEYGFLFAESVTRTIWKCIFNKNNQNQNNNDKPKIIKLITNMASETDNIRYSLNRKTYWLAMISPRIESKKNLNDLLYNYPKIRKIIFKTLSIIGFIFNLINKFIISTNFFEYLSHSLQTLSIIISFMDKGSLLLEIDSNGNFINSFFYDNYTYLSEILEIPSSSSSTNERTLLLGSYINSEIRKIILTPIDN